MSSALAATPPAAPARPPAPERGTTTVADRVIVAVAARAAAEVPGIGGAARRVFGLPVDTDRADRAPQVGPQRRAAVTRRRCSSHSLAALGRRFAKRCVE